MLDLHLVPHFGDLTVTDVGAQAASTLDLKLAKTPGVKAGTKKAKNTRNNIQIGLLTARVRGDGGAPQEIAVLAREPCRQTTARHLRIFRMHSGNNFVRTGQAAAQQAGAAHRVWKTTFQGITAKPGTATQSQIPVELKAPLPASFDRGDFARHG